MRSETGIAPRRQLGERHRVPRSPSRMKYRVVQRFMVELKTEQLGQIIGMKSVPNLKSEAAEAD